MLHLLLGRRKPRNARPAALRGTWYALVPDGSDSAVAMFADRGDAEQERDLRVSDEGRGYRVATIEVVTPTFEPRAALPHLGR